MSFSSFLHTQPPHHPLTPIPTLPAKLHALQQITQQLRSQPHTPVNETQEQELREKGKEIVKEIGLGIVEMGTPKSEKENGMEKRNRQLAQSKLSNDFARAVKDFQDVQRKSAQKGREVVAKAKMGINGQGSHEDEQEHQTPSHPFQYQQQQQLMLREDEDDEDEESELMQKQQIIMIEPQIESNQAVIEEREHEIRGIEQSIIQVNEIFRDLSTIVNEQQSNFDNIEDNIYQVRDQMEGANEELVTANRYQQRSRNKMLCIFFILLTIIGVIVMISLLVKGK